MQSSSYALGLLASIALAGCTTTKIAPASDAHADHATITSMPAAQASSSLPPDAAGAPARLSSSPRHGEWVMIHTPSGDSLHTWVVYPERSTKAPVVVVVHEIFGLSTWVTIQFLITAYFEYYYFIQTIKTTNHLMDALSPLGLGAIQGIAIYCLRRNGSVANLWWLWEFLYVSFGIFAFVHSWLHISVSDMDDCGKTIISERLTENDR